MSMRKYKKTFYSRFVLADGFIWIKKANWPNCNTRGSKGNLPS